MNQEECICALATPAGGAIGIIRLSGSDAITLTDKIFQSANGKSLEEAKPYTLHYGEIKDKDGNTIDDVPVSYTHLDVYKRQQHSCVPCSRFGSSQPPPANSPLR